MTLADELWCSGRDIAEQCLAHPFVRGLGDGSLDRERYRRFIAQDAYFLEAFARGYAYGLAIAPDREGLYAFHRLLNGVFEELELHARSAPALGIELEHVSPAEATSAYTGFLESCIENLAAVGELLAAMTPCMRLYAFLGAALAEDSASGNAYEDWIGTYASAEFRELASTIERLLDRYATGSEAERTRYHRAMELELRFFHASWNANSGDPAQAQER